MHTGRAFLMPPTFFGELAGFHDLFLCCLRHSRCLDNQIFEFLARRIVASTHINMRHLREPEVYPNNVQVAPNGKNRQGRLTDLQVNVPPAAAVALLAGRAYLGLTTGNS